jgi:hypothetical protein
MFKIGEAAGALIAEETKGALRAVDNAILSKLRLCTSLVEIFEQAQLPVNSSQKLLQSMTSGLSQIIAGRGEMAQTVRELNAIKAASNLAETSYNCPGTIPNAIAQPLRAAPKACPEATFG